MRNLVDLLSLSKEDISEIFHIADKIQEGKFKDFLNGKSIVLFFPNTSIRTCVTFEKGIYLLGGQSILFPTETLDKKEKLDDVCGYLNNWADAIIVRHRSIDVVRELARHSTIPIINAMTDSSHPCEIISDMYSLSKIRADFTKDKYLFCGKSGNIGLSWKEAANVLGFELSQCCPKGYEMEGVQVFRDIKEAVKGKDIICTDSLPADILGDFESYQITKEIMGMANENAILNPCPPFYRGEEVSEDVIASDYFVGYQFKRYLLEVQQAIVIYCLMSERYKRKPLQSRRIKISVFLEHLYDAAVQTGQPLESMLEFIRGLGISGVETDFLRLREDPALPELLRRNGIEISCVYAQFDFSHSTDVSGALKVLDVLHANGIKLFMPIPGFCAPEDDREVCRACMLSCMERVIQAAEERGIAVCMEDYDDSSAIYSTAEGLNCFLTALPRLGCAFDTGNFCYSGENELEAFERMRGRITHLHCKDRSRVRKRPGEEEKVSIDGSSLYPAAVGEGIIGIEKIVKELVRGGYNGWFAIEHFGSAGQLEDIRRSVENLRRWEDDLCNGLE